MSIFSNNLSSSKRSVLAGMNAMTCKRVEQSENQLKFKPRKMHLRQPIRASEKTSKLTFLNRSRQHHQRFSNDSLLIC